LVHKGGIADDKFIQAVFSFNANIKDYKKGDRIEINASDWDDIKNIFTELVAQVTKYRKN
jgi:hypothetical protein